MELQHLLNINETIVAIVIAGMFFYLFIMPIFAYVVYKIVKVVIKKILFRKKREEKAYLY